MNYTAEVEAKLRSLAPTTKQTAFADLQAYMGTGYEMLGMTVPQQRTIFKQGYSFSGLPLTIQLKIWDEVWKTALLFETLTQAALFAEKNLDKLAPEEAWRVLKSWVKKVENWGHSDMLSGFYGKLLASHPVIYDQLVKWNVSKKPWERRQSLVTLAMYYRRYDLLPFDVTKPLIAALIHDEDYFVQKGVGWVLREAGNRFPKEVWNYLEAHCTDFTSTAFATAIEKRSPQQKETLKQLRKKHRQKNA